MNGNDEPILAVQSVEEPLAPMPAGGSPLGLSELQGLAVMAQMRPRDEKRALAAVFAALENNPEFAEKGIYQVPRAGTTIVGTGVHGARAIATAFRNNMRGSRILEFGPERAIVSGHFVDAENGIIVTRERIVSRTQHTKKKGTFRLTEDDYLNQVRVEQSKAERDAILSGVPRYLVDKFFEKAFAMANKRAEKSGKTPLERWAEAGEALKKYRVPEAAALAFVGMEKREELTHALVTKLGHAIVAIQQGEASVAGVFGEYMGDKREEAAPDLPKATVNEPGPSTPPEAPSGGASRGKMASAPDTNSGSADDPTSGSSDDSTPPESEPESSEKPSADEGWDF